MALTQDVIQSNEVLASLTDEQISAITTLSANDEQININTAIGEHNGRIEQDVFEVSGIPKQDGEKYFEYTKRVLGEFKTSASNIPTLQTEIDTYKAKVSDLEAKIESGSGDQATLQKLRDTEANLTALQSQYEAEKNGWSEKEKEFQGQIAGIQVSAEFGKATSGLKFKAEYPESVQKTLIDSAKNGILAAAKPDWTEVEGKKTMVFRGTDGEVLRNKANGLKPYTAQELIADKLKDVIDLGQKKPGAGTKNPEGKPNTIELTDVSGAKTQVEADAMIQKYLLQQGLMRGTAEFAAKQTEIRTKNSVSELPMR